VTTGIAGALRAYRKARDNVLKGHWTSWLYNVEHTNFIIFQKILLTKGSSIPQKTAAAEP